MKEVGQAHMPVGGQAGNRSPVIRPRKAGPRNGFGSTAINLNDDKQV